MADIRRRDLIALLGGAMAAWPVPAPAQQQGERMVRLGYLRLAPAAQSQREERAFREGLRDLGYVEGKNLQIEYRSTEGDQTQLNTLATELAALKLDVIVAHADGVAAVLRASRTIPVVMAVGPDLVALGFAESLAHPGGNVTGSTFFLAELLAKRLELLKELAPSVAHVGLLLIRRADGVNTNLEVVQTTATGLGMQLHPVEVRGPADFESAFASWADVGVGGLVMGDHSQLVYNSDAVAALALRQHLPSVGPLILPENGGLAGYGVNFIDIFRRSAYFIDKILKGTKPGDIPIEQPTKFASSINLKTAKALGLDVPDKLLALADELVE